MEQREQELKMGMKCIKYMLFVSNFLFAMIGFLLISIGATVLTVYDDLDDFMKDYYFSPAKILIAIGCFILFTALFGCLAAIKESTCLINAFSYILIALLILEVAGVISAYAVRNNLKREIRSIMTDTIEKEDYRPAWDKTQELLECCGVEDGSSWEKYLNHSDSWNVEFNVPSSCMKEGDPESSDNLYKEGCLMQLTYVISEFSLLIAAAGLCVIFIQLLGIIFAQLLGTSIRRLKTEILVMRQENRNFYEQLAKGDVKKVSPVLYVPSNVDEP